MNKVFLIGRLVRNPEILRKSESLSITNFTLAVDDSFSALKKKTNFIRCVAFNKLAITIEKYLSKGSKVAVEGRINMQTYEKDGMKRNSFDIIVSSTEFLDSRNFTGETKTSNKKNDVSSYNDKEKNFDDNNKSKGEEINFNEDINWGE